MRRSIAGFVDLVMRNFLLAPILASLALSTIRPADACGPYVMEPSLLLLSSHYTERGTRSFVHLGEPVGNGDQLTWDLLAPHTYDHASTVDAPDLESPKELTLIGPKGTKVVASMARVVLRNTFVSRHATAALEITMEDHEFAIAMAGKHADAKWIALSDARKGTAADIAWVNARGLTPLAPEYVSVSKLGEYDLVNVLAKGAGITTFVRRGNQLYTQFDGAPMGGVTTRGMRYIVASKHDVGLTAIAI